MKLQDSYDSHLQQLSGRGKRKCRLMPTHTHTHKNTDTPSLTHTIICRYSAVYVCLCSSSKTYIHEIRDVIREVFTDGRVGSLYTQQVVIAGLQRFQLVLRVLLLLLQTTTMHIIITQLIGGLRQECKCKLSNQNAHDNVKTHWVWQHMLYRSEYTNKQNKTKKNPTNKTRACMSPSTSG